MDPLSTVSGVIVHKIEFCLSSEYRKFVCDHLIIDSYLMIKLFKLILMSLKPFKEFI